METAGEGGPYGMALLAAFLMDDCDKLEVFLSDKVFKDAKSVTLAPDSADAEGFDRYLGKFRSGLAVERAAVENM